MPELMKGHVWQERKHLVKYPVFAEIKHDEIRCHVVVHSDHVEFKSYAGKPLANMEGFATLFYNACRDTLYTEFDCGFEVNGNFRDSSRWVRSTRGLPPDLENASACFYLFDLPENRDPFWIRRNRIIDVATSCGLRYVKGTNCANESDVDAAFAAAREDGKEGLMIKAFDHTYKRGKRTDDWLKFKPEKDASGVITLINQAYASKDDPDKGILAGDPLGRAGSVTVVLEDGSTASPHGIPHALGIEMWENPHAFLGETIDFKYMQREPTGGYRHCVWGRIREAVV